MVLWSPSWHQAHIVIQAYTYDHTIIHIHAYTYNHAMMLRTGIWNIPMKRCTYPRSLHLHRCSSADWLSDLWSLRLPPVRFTGVMVGSLDSAAATCSLPNRLSNRLPLRLRPGSWPGRFSKCWCLRLPPLEFVRSLVSVPATRAVYGIACQNFLHLPPGSWPDWFWKW